MTQPSVLAALDAAVEPLLAHFGESEPVVINMRAARDLVAAAVTDSGEAPKVENRTPCEWSQDGTRTHRWGTGRAKGECDNCDAPRWVAGSAVGVDDTTTHARQEPLTAHEQRQLPEAVQIVNDLRSRLGAEMSEDEEWALGLLRYHAGAAPTSGVADTERDASCCGASPPLTFGGLTPVHCLLRAGHSGWHRSDEGTEWSRDDATDDERDTDLADRVAALDQPSRARVDFLAAQFVPHWVHLTEEARDGVRPGIAGFLRELDGVR